MSVLSGVVCLVILEQCMTVCRLYVVILSILFLLAIAIDDLLFAECDAMRSFSIVLNNDSNQSAWNVQVGDFIERTCPTCACSHKTIVYKRLTNPGDIDFKNLFLINVGIPLA